MGVAVATGANGSSRVGVSDDLAGTLLRSVVVVVVAGVVVVVVVEDDDQKATDDDGVLLGGRLSVLAELLTLLRSICTVWASPFAWLSTTRFCCPVAVVVVVLVVCYKVR